MTLQRLQGEGFLLVVLVLWPSAAALGQGIEVRLKDGSSCRGTAERSSDESKLRLRDGQPDAYIVYAFDWHRIAEIRDEDRSWLPDGFADYRAYLAKRFDNPFQDAARENRDRVELSLPSRSPADSNSSAALASTSSAGDRVRFIEIDAVAANWDHGVAWDGIALRVWPINENGQVIRTSGTISVTLTGERGRDATRGAGPRDTAPDRLAHWVRIVRPADFGPDGVSVRLEFQDSHPERCDAAWHPDHWIEPRGEVHVRMSVPGHGVFSASTNTPIRLRRASALRDRQFNRIGTRFFLPTEY